MGKSGASALANLLQQVAFWIQLFGAAHGAVQTEVQCHRPQLDVV